MSRSVVVLSLATVASVVLIALAGCDDVRSAVPRGESLRVADVLGGDDDGYARAIEPRDFDFPEDHGPHPDFRSEWWYVTGNLDSADGRRFGYHLTFFRNAVAPEPPEPAVGHPSDWRTRQVWMAHFAVADVTAGEEHAFERFQRGALGLAGARATPFAVHLADWSLRAVDPDRFAPFELRAADGDVRLTITLDPEKAIVSQGDRGLSAKSARPGNASYYFSIPRLAARGELEIGGVTHRVTGSGWLDREWSTSALDDDQVGWDWFALQLDDGRDLMFYRMRLAGGGADPTSSGVLVDADGRVTKLPLDDVELEVLRRWTSPESDASYPVAWRLAAPALGLDLDVEAAFDAQELDLSVRYWEGAVDVRRHGTATRLGRGYLEMTGYAD